jgi:NAD(P)-dependent dehydrogenase (short-subunit alcohol dehydrogenase family)
MVTGAARGIGRATAKCLLDGGWRVALLDVDGVLLTKTAADFGPEALALQADLAQECQVLAAFAELERRWGRLDALVNNGASAAPNSGPPTELSLDCWRQVLSVNLDGAFLCAREAARRMVTGGAIVNITSTRALQSEPHCEAYAASKGGLLALTHALALSLGPSIRVNAIAPGWIATGAQEVAGLRMDDHRQHPVGRVGLPQDVANLVKYLLSDEAGFITGQQFIVDGGMTRKMIYAS